MQAIAKIRILEDGDLCTGFVVEAGEITSVHPDWAGVEERLRQYLDHVKASSKAVKYQESGKEKS